VDVVVSRNLHPGKDEQVVYYAVRPHDQLGEIASAFGVTEADLARWNRLSPSAHLLKGMSLQIIVAKKTRLDDVRYIRPEKARVFLAGSSEFHEHFEGMKGKKRMLVSVKKGETLVGIGSRYGMTVGSMERVNQRSRSTVLVEGEQLIVYTDKHVRGQDAEEMPGSLPPIDAPHPELLPSAAR
jgi:membrane-bound lytic murein transglycosylase D